MYRLPFYSGEESCLIHCKCVSVYVCVRALEAVSIQSLRLLKPDPSLSGATPPRHQPLAFRVLARPPREPMCALNKLSA